MCGIRVVIRSQQKVQKKNQKIRWASGGQHAKGQPPAPPTGLNYAPATASRAYIANLDILHTGPPWAVGVPGATTSSCPVPPPPPRGRCGVLTLALLAGPQPPGSCLGPCPTGTGPLGEFWGGGLIPSSGTEVVPISVSGACRYTCTCAYPLEVGQR